MGASQCYHDGEAIGGEEAAESWTYPEGDEPPAGTLSEHPVNVPRTNRDDKRKPISFSQKVSANAPAAMEEEPSPEDEEELMMVLSVMGATDANEVVHMLKAHGHNPAITEACITRGMQLATTLGAKEMGTLATPFLEAMFTAMDFHDADANVSQWGLSALADLSEKAEECRSVGCLHAIVQAMHRFPAATSLQASGCRALYNQCHAMTKKSIARKEAALAIGALVTVISAMERFGNRELFGGDDEEELQLWGCAAISSLTATESAVERAVHAHAIEAVICAMKAHPSSVQVFSEGAAALSNLCHGMSPPSLMAKAAAFEAGGVPSIVLGLGALESEEQAQAYGFGALANMVRGCSNATEQALEMKADAIAKAALGRFGGSSSVQKKAKALITNLKVKSK